MAGPCGLEPQTSTVSKRRDYVLTTTYNALGAAQVRVSTPKTESLQVKLQVKKFAERKVRHRSSATTIELCTQSPVAQSETAKPQDEKKYAALLTYSQTLEDQFQT
jgi:hypothetical protein